MKTIRILLVDDHTLVRQGMKSLLEAQPGFEVVGEGQDGQEAVKLAEHLNPDVVIMDVMMPTLNGIEAAKLMRQRGLATAIVFLSMHANATYAVRALQSGGQAYVLKEAGFDEILLAIEAACQNRRYLSHLIADEVLEMLLNAEPDLGDALEVLTLREREVLQLIAEGNTNAAVAEKLSISVRTVEAHRAHLMSKLHITSYADLVKFALKHGIIAS